MNEPGPELISPYLNPAYWDGRMVGQASLDPVTRSYQRGQAKFANRTVANYLENRRTPYPLETFHLGDEINANNHAPGTIFYGNREILMANGPVEPPADTSTDPANLPAQPSDVGFELLDYAEDFKQDAQEGLSRRYLLQVDNVRYSAMRSFIVVTRGRRGRNNLQPVNEFGMYRMPDGSIANGISSAPMDTPFVIGLTRHTRIGSHEQLHRVNTLMLSSEAQATKSMSFAEKLGTVSLNPFANKT
ncbi:MAG: hypothetical protein WAO28_00250 [Candidatus Microsaccharimonas sp.]